MDKLAQKQHMYQWMLDYGIPNLPKDTAYTIRSICLNRVYRVKGENVKMLKNKKMILCKIWRTPMPKGTKRCLSCDTKYKNPFI